AVRLDGDAAAARDGVRDHGARVRVGRVLRQGEGTAAAVCVPWNFNRQRERVIPRDGAPRGFGDLNENVHRDFPLELRFGPADLGLMSGDEDAVRVTAVSD